ncbi:ATP-binding cassette domain-containing protein [Iocasia frigidifontis]|uniref:ATP-binding cassette domain-containing protein n=1 Tax=Iocasia fonsfrigidae TaxID=2682810 RepID=A0A8A7KHU5_9FIRM|nr:ABC transporter ATP-binding protein [Iocasia fonsfrigidae]QTL97452.1 ATP-binding cassette domain-containing protein [Iocasia fonsfrigidae]
MIEVKDLHFTYPGNSNETIRGISFNISKGEIFGFLGPSGAGKSTTQKIIIGLLRDYQGQVKVMDQEIRDWGKDYYERIGISFELPSLYNKLTAMENLSFIASLYNYKKTDFMELLEMVGLSDQADIKAANFSKGMKMRLNFARAFVHQPELIFLDEPTSGLDPVNAKKIKEIILDKKKEGKTIFLTTHNMTVADELCDRVAFIVDGQIKLIDSPKELKIKRGKKLVRVEYYQGKKTLSQEFPLEKIGENHEFNKLLKSKEIKTIHTQEASLDDIFIETTGRNL